VEAHCLCTLPAVASNMQGKTMTLHHNQLKTLEFSGTQQQQGRQQHTYRETSGTAAVAFVHSSGWATTHL